MKNKNSEAGKGSLIVNADDFGLSSHINKGIIECVEKGAVNSVSLVANGDALDEAIDFCKSRPGLLPGIHFTLIDEKPVSDPARVPSLVDEQGFFYPDYKRFIVRYISGKINPAEVKIELSAQVEKLIAKGITLAHADSHQHLHLLKRISNIVIPLCRTFRIPRIRIVNEAVDPAYWKQMIPLLAMKYFSQRIKRQIRDSGITTASRFFGFNTSMHVNRQIIKKALWFSEKYPVELMCHPGINTGEPGRYGKWGMDWDRERETIIAGLAGKF
jgi:predicted glycoside hydrolase/deacetylase ChbG (UPF0249 family)